MRAFFLAASLILASASVPLFAQAGDNADFEQVCARVSTNDQLPQGAIAPFCSCLTGKAAKDDALHAELEKAALTEPNQEKRMQMLTPVARAAVESCRAAIPKGN